MKRLLAACLVASLGTTTTAAWGRTWTDSTGNYEVAAELVAFNENQVVLKRTDDHLLVVPIDRLSQADRDYLQSKEGDAARKAADVVQTWTMTSGMSVVGKVVDYARRDVTIQRRRGKIYVNDRLLDNMPELYQKALPRIVAHFEQIDLPDRAAFEAWVLTLRGQPRTFTFEGVVLELENGDEYTVPFFFFAEESRKTLQAGWDRWLAAEKDRVKQEQEAFLLQSQAQAYQQDRKADREIAMMQLQLQAYQAGLFDLWEVRLVPQRGAAGPPLWVVVPARDSRSAVAQALQLNPGYAAGPVSRVSRRL